MNSEQQHRGTKYSYEPEHLHNRAYLIQICITVDTWIVLNIFKVFKSFFGKEKLICFGLTKVDRSMLTTTTNTIYLHYSALFTFS